MGERDSVGRQIPSAVTTDSHVPRPSTRTQTNARNEALVWVHVKSLGTRLYH